MGVSQLSNELCIRLEFVGVVEFCPGEFLAIVDVVVEEIAAQG